MTGTASALQGNALADPGEIARAMQVDKPPAEIPDQLDMFGEVSA